MRGKNFSLIVLAGGQSRRFGSDKTELEILGQSLLNRILLSLPDQIPVILVGAPQTNLLRKVRVVREEPLHGGPVAGLAAGLPFVESDLVGVLAIDMPFATPLLLRLLQEFPSQAEAFIPTDVAGFRQPLCAIYQREPLARALNLLGNPANKSMRELLVNLDVVEMKIEVDAPRELLDIDTQEDLLRAIAFLEKSGENLGNGGLQNG